MELYDNKYFKTRQIAAECFETSAPEFSSQWSSQNHVDYWPIILLDYCGRTHEIEIRPSCVRRSFVTVKEIRTLGTESEIIAIQPGGKFRYRQLC